MQGNHLAKLVQMKPYGADSRYTPFTFGRCASEGRLCEGQFSAESVLGADKACKQTGSPDQLIAERLAFSIAGRARRLGL